jgi:DNA (cytosine-5)-methyltransferase 1
MKRPIVIDLFAGCGGMSLGLEAAGFDIVASVEIDPIHSLIHHVNFPYGVTICRDISLVSSQEILEKIKAKGYSTDIDLIVGCPPCQGFSLIGKRQIDDPRNGLIFEYLRMIKELKPKYFLFENVPGITTGEHRQLLDELITEIDKIGYGIVTPIQVLDAVNFGAAQKRKRLILMGYQKGLKIPSYPNFLCQENQQKDILPLFNNSNCQKFVTVFEAISDLENQEVFLTEDRGINAETLTYEGYRQHFNLLPDGNFKYCHQRTINNKIYGHIGSKHTSLSQERFKTTIPGKIEPKSRFLKLAPDGQCNTLRAGTNSDRGAHTAPRPIHYLHPRCISIREGARLHTFPDWFQFHRTIWHGFREIGNAVVPFLALALGAEIRKCLNVDISQLEIYNLPEIDADFLSFNMTQASKYWGIAHDVIAKRKRSKNLS